MSAPEALAQAQESEARGLPGWPASFKLVGALLTCAAALAIPVGAPWAQAALLACLLATGLASGVRPRTFAVRLLPLAVMGIVALPFLLLTTITAQTGLWRLPLIGIPVARSSAVMLWAIVSKSGLVVMGFTVLSQVMARRELLIAARTLHLPRVLRVMSYLAAAWVEDLRREMRQMQRAAVSRGTATGWRRIRLVASLARALILRSVRRADTIAFALCARGFQGDLPILHREHYTVAQQFALLIYCLLIGTLVWLAF